MKNWKTTLAGIAMIIGAIANYVNNPLQIEASITALIAGIGLISAGDAGNNKNNLISDEEIGLPKPKK